MWTDDAREKYRMIARGYPSSMSDAEWALLEPHFPAPMATAVHGLLRGKDMRHPMRRIVDAIFYVLRNGVTWRALPLDFPPWQTVYYWFRRFARAALFERLNAFLVAVDRVQTGREAQPTAAVMDSQTVKATEAPAPRDYDGGKKLTGLKTPRACGCRRAFLDSRLLDSAPSRFSRRHRVAEGCAASMSVPRIDLGRFRLPRAPRREGRRAGTSGNRVRSRRAERLCRAEAPMGGRAQLRLAQPSAPTVARLRSRLGNNLCHDLRRQRVHAHASHCEAERITFPGVKQALTQR